MTPREDEDDDELEAADASSDEDELADDDDADDDDADDDDADDDDADDDDADDDALLTPEQEQTFLAWLEEHVQHGCAVCGGAEWTTARELYAPLLYDHQQGAFDVEAGAPCAMATCGTCGYVMLFNARVLGLLD